MDLIVYKYQMDSNKIEGELSELESVIDELRENILKHKCNSVNIDDVECYALTLSHLSKQLVNLKSSFSAIKDQVKQTNSELNATGSKAVSSYYDNK